MPELNASHRLCPEPSAHTFPLPAAAACRRVLNRCPNHLCSHSTFDVNREATRQLAARGAQVVMACRNLEAAERVASEIRTQHPGASVEVGPCLDLSSLDSVREFAAAYKQRYSGGLDVLVNNAGERVKG